MPTEAMSRAFRPFHEVKHDLDYTKLAYAPPHAVMPGLGMTVE